MHIPRQPDGGRGPHAGHASHDDGATAVPGAAGPGADGLRVRRQHLVRRLRTIAYWQRLVQARTDLVVAGLLYNATPVPVGRILPVPFGAPATTAGSRVATTSLPQDADDLHSLGEPPEGLDVPRLLSCTDDTDGPGALLERLQGAADLLATHRHRLDHELDTVTLALHDRLAADGAEQSAGASTGTIGRTPRATAAGPTPVTR